jgi:hypothetical protein
MWTCLKKYELQNCCLKEKQKPKRKSSMQPRINNHLLLEKPKKNKNEFDAAKNQQPFIIAKTMNKLS